jgi:hypothetical protein
MALLKMRRKRLAAANVATRLEMEATAEADTGVTADERMFKCRLWRLCWPIKIIRRSAAS